MTGIFQDIKNGNPVFAGGFHTDLHAVVVKEPFFKSFEVRIESGKLLLDIRSNAVIVCNSDGSDKQFFMDVHVVADKVFNR